MNAELTEPIEKNMTAGWDKTMNASVSSAIRACQQGIMACFSQFETTLKKRLLDVGFAEPRIEVNLLEHRYNVVFVSSCVSMFSL